MDATPTASRTARRLAIATGGVSLVGGLWTFADPGLLFGPEAMQGSARGTALVLVCVALPWLAWAIWAAQRGSSSALLLWAAALLYIVYNAVLFLFLTPFNAAFLLYVAMLSLALWSLGYLAVARDLWHAGARIACAAPVRGLSIYVGVVVALNALAWLRVIVPALDDPYPTKMLAGTGVMTNAIYVQDLAIWLPLAAAACVWLARHEARGAILVGAMLGMWVIESISIAVDQWYGAQADPESTVVSSAGVIPFLVLAIVGSVPLVVMLRANGRDGRATDGSAAAAGPPRRDRSASAP
ncbi:hypothetical protein ACWEOW_00850 [Monashia sp. NPDC004114]